MTELKGKVAVITGAASGIGYALAKALSMQGMSMVLADIEDEALTKAEIAIKTIGAQVISVKADVSKFTEVERLSDIAFSKFGAVHVLCNNAGVMQGSMRGRFTWERTCGDWNWILGVNLWGVIHGIKAFVPRMTSQNIDCHIVNTASIAGLVSVLFFSLYNTTKHAVVGLTETLYRELKIVGSKIGVSVLCPVWTSSRLSESERNRLPVHEENENCSDLDEEAAGLGVYLDSAYAQYPAEIEEMHREVKDADEVADAVVNAILNNRFYIFTHTSWMKFVSKRFSEILNEENPDLLI